MQTVQLSESQPARPASAAAFSLTVLQKSILLVLILGLLYVRLLRRRRLGDRLCPHCNTRNPRHLAHCRHCGAPLFQEPG